MTEKINQSEQLSSQRIIELQENPVKGVFDATHLKEVHRRIFQDSPEHRPGQTREDTDGYNKHRSLESSIQRYIVPYECKDIEKKLNDALNAFNGVDGLKNLPKTEVAEKLAKLYETLDKVHSFSEGNSRTLREFTRQLADESGFKLHWQQTGKDAQNRDRLYLARDIAVLEKTYPNLDQKRAMETPNRSEYESYFFLQKHKNADRLEKIINESLEDHKDIYRNNSEKIHGYAIDSLTKNKDVLKQNGNYQAHSEQDIEKAAYWRGVHEMSASIKSQKSNFSLYDEKMADKENLNLVPNANEITEDKYIKKGNSKNSDLSL